MSKFSKKGGRKISKKNVTSSSDNRKSSEFTEFDYLPTMSEEKWSELIKNEEEDKVYFKTISEIYKETREEQKVDYTNKIVYPFTAMCCHVAWTKVLNMYFQRCDPGEKTEDITTEWKPEDEPPSPSPMDSWASWHINTVSEPVTETFKDKKETGIESKVVIKEPAAAEKENTPNELFTEENYTQEITTFVDLPVPAEVNDTVQPNNEILPTSAESIVLLKLCNSHGVLHGHYEELINYPKTRIPSLPTDNGSAKSLILDPLPEEKEVRGKSKDTTSITKNDDASVEEEQLSDDSYGSNSILLQNGRFDLQDEYGYSLVTEDFSKEVCDVNNYLNEKQLKEDVCKQQNNPCTPIILDNRTSRPGFVQDYISLAYHTHHPHIIGTLKEPQRASRGNDSLLSANPSTTGVP